MTLLVKEQAGLTRILMTTSFCALKLAAEVVELPEQR